MAKLAITKVSIDNKKVATGSKIKIVAYAYSITQEPINQRLSFVLGKPKIKT